MIDRNLNIFNHAPKELVTDAFITWLLYFLDSDKKFEKQKQILFSKLFLNKVDAAKKVSDIKIIRRESGISGQVDLILSFNLEEVEQQILFENKTWTCSSHKQLEGYKRDYPDMYKYIFLKLAYMSNGERSLAIDNGYEIICMHRLENALNDLSGIHVIINQYIEYLNQNYIHPFSIVKNQIDICEYHSLSDRQAQIYFFNRIMNNMVYGVYTEMGSSFGVPWTQLNILFKKIAKYINEYEFIFWRIDNSYELKLCKYSYVDKDFQSLKLQRLIGFRNIANNILVEKFQTLKPDKPTATNHYTKQILRLNFEENKGVNFIDFVTDFSTIFRERVSPFF